VEVSRWKAEAASWPLLAGVPGITSVTSARARPPPTDEIMSASDSMADKAAPAGSLGRLFSDGNKWV
jgi:hypothetical protein